VGVSRCLPTSHYGPGAEEEPGAHGSTKGSWMGQGGETAMTEKLMESLKWKLDALRILAEDDQPDLLDIQLQVGYVDSMVRHGLDKSPEGKEYLRILLDNAAKWTEMFNLRGSLGIVEHSPSRWWWWLPEIAAGRMPRPEI